MSKLERARSKIRSALRSKPREFRVATLNERFKWPNQDRAYHDQMEGGISGGSPEIGDLSLDTLPAETGAGVVAFLWRAAKASGIGAGFRRAIVRLYLDSRE